MPTTKLPHTIQHHICRGHNYHYMPLCIQEALIKRRIKEHSALVCTFKLPHPKQSSCQRLGGGTNPVNLNIHTLDFSISFEDRKLT